MRIINRSALQIDEAFWRSVGDILGVEEKRRSQRTGKANALNVIVDVQKSRDGEKKTLFGLHSQSKILIFPCRDCTSGTVLITFLHEIMHEWIFWQRPKLYNLDWTEDLCEGTAQAVFQLVGGNISAEKSCRKYQIYLPVKPMGIQVEVVQLLTGLTQMSPDQLRDFGQDERQQRLA